MSNERPEVRRTIDELGPWFHNLHLGSAGQTVPDHPFGDFPAFKWREMEPFVPEDLQGRSALDIGCNAGFYSFELAKRGADVLAIDSSDHYLRQASWAATELELADRVEFRRMQVYDLARLDRAFDLVLFLGVLYHLRYPLLALDLVSRKAAGTLVLQTLTMPGDEVEENTSLPKINERDALRSAGWPSMAFIEEAMADDPTNWWVPNHACILSMLRSCGLKVVHRPGHEIYVCEPDPKVQRVRPDEDEYRAATGLRP